MSKKGQKALASATIMSLVLTTALTTMPAMADTTVGAGLKGTDRVATSIAIADQAYATWKTSTTAVIACGANGNMVDALAVAPLAYAKQAPIYLTTNSKAIDASVIASLTNHKVTTVYLIGADKNDENIAALKAAGITTVTPLSGATRFETAQAINTELEKLGAPKAYAVVNGYAMADALSVASIAAKQDYEIVLAKDKNTTPVVPAGKTVYAIGGTGVISDTVKTALGATRLGGNTRFETNAEVLKGLDASLDYTTTYVADGTDAHMVDALPGSVFAGQTSSPIVLVNSAVGVDAAVNTVLTGKAGKVTTITPLGGAVTSAITDAIKTAVTASSLQVQSVSATAANTLKVTLNHPVDTTKAVLTVKSGTSTFSVKATWNDAKTEATLVKSSSNFAAGDYTVTLSGVDNIDANNASKTITIKDQTVTSIAFIGNDLVKNAGGTAASFKYVVKDQYGTDITKYVTLSQSSSISTLVLDPSTGTGTITHDFANDLVNKTATVVLVDSSTGVSATATLNIANSIQVTSMTYGDVKLPTSATRLQKFAAGTYATIPVTAVDQYGNTIDDYTELSGSVQLLSSSTEVSFAFDEDADGNPVIKIDTHGLTAASTVLMTAFVNANGKTFPKSFDVAMPVAPKSVTFGDFSEDTIAAGDAVYLPITVLDQFGAEMSKDDVVTAKDTITAMITKPSNVGTLAIVTDRNSSHYGQLKLTGLTKGTGVLVATSTSGVATKTITVKDARVLTDITAPSVINLMQGATKKISFTYLDQYGEEIDSADLANNTDMKYFATLTKVSGDTNCVADHAGNTLALAAVTDDETNLVGNIYDAAASLTGSYKLTVKLVKSTVTTGATSVSPADVLSTATTTINVVKNNVSGLTYSIEAIPTIPGDQAYTKTSPYARAITVDAKDATGNTYVINAADIVGITSSDTSIAAVDPASGVVFGNDVKTGNTAMEDKKATVTVTINTLDGLKTVTSDVTVSPKAPVVQEVRVLNASIAGLTSPSSAWVQDDLPDGAANALTCVTGITAAKAGTNFYVAVKDQYGVWQDATTATVVVNSTDVIPYNALSYASGKLTLAAGVTPTKNTDIKATVFVGSTSVQFIINFNAD